MSTAFHFEQAPADMFCRAVVPANIDIATQEIIQMAEDADPDGQRTLGVLTKPDLVDRGAEEKVCTILHSNKDVLIVPRS